MKRGTITKIAQKVGKSKGFISNIVCGNKPCPRVLAVELERVTRIKREIWVFSPEKVRQELDKRFPRAA